MQPESYPVFFIFYLLCFELISTNSGSTLWKLNSDGTKIIDGTEIQPKLSLFETSIIREEDFFDIVSSTVFNGETWLKQSKEKVQNVEKEQEDKKQEEEKMQTVENLNTKCPLAPKNPEEKVPAPATEIKPHIIIEESMFDCGDPVNFTHYDNLMGVYNRYTHPNITNPQSASMFGYHSHSEVSNNEDATLMIDFSDYIKFLVRCIRKARQQKLQTATLYNFIGNYWQLKGFSLKSIECFRRGLSISPHNARILLNLARLLYSLQYLDDAIYMTKRSLEMEQVQNSVWIHHFTLGEIFKAYGLYQEAILHLNHSLKLKPDLVVAKLILQQIHAMHVSEPIHSNTIYIIVLLAFLVLAIILLLHNLGVDMHKRKHVIRITDSSSRYFKTFRRHHKCRKPSA